MKTNKEEASQKMFEYAEQLARNYGLNCVEEKQSTFFADFGSREVKWVNGKDKDISVEFRSRFGCPRIDFHHRKDFAAVELGQGYRPTGETDDHGFEKHEYDGIYRPNEIQAWGEGGLAMATIMWLELSELIHQPTNDFIEEEVLKTPKNAKEQINGQMTVWGLYKALEKYIADGGHVNAFALVSDDVECNGYHGLFFGIEEHDYTAGITDNLSDTNQPAPVQPVIA